MGAKIRGNKLIMKEEPFLKKRVALRADITIILIAWLIVLFTISTNFFFYQNADSNDAFFLSKSWVPSFELAIEKAVESLQYLGGVAAAISTVFLLDRKIAVNRARKIGVKFKIPKAKEKLYSIDKKSILIVILVFFLSIPWFFAQLGIYIGDIPVADSLFYSRQIPNLDGQRFPAVHLGHHHGWDGAVIFSLMMLVIPLIKWIYDRRLRFLAGIAWSVMIAYSFYQFAEDFINEQIFKRLEIQNMLPAPSADIQITLSVAITVGILLYVYFWKHQESKVNSK